MEIKIEDLESDGLDRLLDENEHKIKQYKDSYDKIIEQQVNLFNAWAEKLSPVIKYIKSKHYRFYHPSKKIDILSSRGPVIGYDDYNSVAYMYDVDKSGIVSVEMNTDKTSYVSKHKFFQDFSFEIAMEGLLEVLKFQEVIVREYKEDIDKRERLIEKYKLD